MSDYWKVKQEDRKHDAQQERAWEDAERKAYTDPDAIQKTMTAQDLLDAFADGDGDPLSVAEALLKINTTTDKEEQIAAAYEAAHATLDVMRAWADAIAEMRR